MGTESGAAMSVTEHTSLLPQAQNPPLYRNVTFVKWVGQVFALVVVLFFLIFLANQGSSSLQNKGYTGGYDFLGIDPGFEISEGIDTDPNTGGRALWAGMVNTIRLAVAGIFLATLIGTLAGVGRLSKNWLVRRIMSFYVETMRNVPLLVQIFIINAILAVLPLLEIDQGPINGWLHLSNKGLSVPRVFIGDGFYQWLVLVLIGVALGELVRRYLLRQQRETGIVTYPVARCMLIVILAAALGWWLHPICGWVGYVFEGLATVFDHMPQMLIQILVSVIAVSVAIFWIKREIDLKRSPVGDIKLTENSYFRMILAGFAAIAVICFITLVWPGLASWIMHSGRDLFELLADKFGNGRSGLPIDAMRPNISKSGQFANYGSNGLNLSRALASIYFGVVLYTGAFIAEIVRGGILSVPKGQKEAALAIGLRRSVTLRRVVLPQALRVILPPLGNQYLNLTKNTSLAIAVGYSDVVQVGQTLYNQTGRTFEVVSLWMLFYLACSLTISVVVNFFNLRLKIVER